MPAASFITSTPPAARRFRLFRALVHRCDLFAVLGLLGSSAVYAVGALAHLA